MSFLRALLPLTVLFASTDVRADFTPDLPGASGLPIVVTNHADAGPGSLRQAIADAPPGSVITFDPSLSGGTITFGAGARQYDIFRNLTIDASMLPDGFTIDANGEVTKMRIFEVAGASRLVLRCLTLTGGNSVAWGGGAINSGGRVVLDRVTLCGNTALWGGAFYSSGGTLDAINCTFSGNRAINQAADRSRGGAINIAGSVANLTHCTVAGNHATGGGGGILNDGGTLTINNCIVCDNTKRGLVEANIAGRVNSGSNNIASGSASLAPLGDYGGPNQTMPPLRGSPAVEAASASTLSGDQRDRPRPVGGVPDLGAVESQPDDPAILPKIAFTPEIDERIVRAEAATDFPTAVAPAPADGLAPEIVVTSAADAGPGSLRQALADAAPGATISFAAALSGETITLTSTELSLEKTVTIDASTLPEGIMIDADGESADRRVMRMGGRHKITLRSMTLTGGSTITGGGGAIFLESAELTLDRVTICHNTALWGGALYSSGGTLNATNCTFTGNTATDNSPNTSRGGALNAWVSTFNLIHCTISGNHGRDGGGGILNNFDRSSISLTNCIVAGNSKSGPAESNITGKITRDNGDNITSGKPSLAPLGNYGGPTQTMPPLPGSPVIDAAAAGVVAVDQRGRSRPAGEAPDLGAVEHRPDEPEHSAPEPEVVAVDDPATAAPRFIWVGPSNGGDGSDFFAEANWDSDGEAGAPFTTPAPDSITASEPIGASLRIAVGSPAASGHLALGDNGSLTMTGGTLGLFNFGLHADEVMGGLRAKIALSGSAAITDTSFIAEQDMTMSGATTITLSDGGNPLNEVAIDFSPGWTGSVALTNEPPENMVAEHLVKFTIAGKPVVVGAEPGDIEAGDTAVVLAHGDKGSAFRLVDAFSGTIVTTTADAGPGSLRQTIANASPGDAITFAKALSGGTIQLTSGQLTLSGNLTIDASSLGRPLTIDAGSAGHRIFEIAPGGHAAVFDSLTLTGGKAEGEFPADRGGAILNNGGDLTLRNTTLRGNTAIHGGAVYTDRGSLTVKQSTLENNTARASGGAVASRGASSAVTCEATTFTANSAQFAGAIRHGDGSLSLRDCTVVGNEAEGGRGAGLVLENGRALLRDIVLANHGSAAEPDIAGSGCMLTLEGTNLISDNTSLNYAHLLAPGFPNADGDFIGTADTPFVPQLAPLGRYGDRTETMPRLLAHPSPSHPIATE